MRAEQAESWPLPHSGRVRRGMKKQITVMSMKATICIFALPIHADFHLFPLFFFIFHRTSFNPLIYFILSCFPASIFSNPLFFLLATPTFYTGLISLLRSAAQTAEIDSIIHSSIYKQPIRPMYNVTISGKTVSV